MLIIYDFINTIVYVLLAYLFIRIFISPRMLKKHYTFLYLIIWCILEILIVKLFNDTFHAKAFLSILTTCIISSFIWMENKRKICILAIAHYVLALIFDFFAYLIAIRFTGYIHLFTINQSIAFIYGGVISQLLYLIAIVALSFLFRKDKYKQINFLDFLKFTIVPIISISIIISFAFYSNDKELSSGDIKFYTYLSICFLVANLYMFWEMKIDVDNKIQITKSKARIEHASELQTLYNQITIEHQQIASIEHEYKNFISLINYFISIKDYSQIEQLVKNNKLTPIYTDIVNTGNTITSAVINAKYAEALRQSITVRLDLDNLSNIKIDDTDLIIILSNLFNNAIEACTKCNNYKLIELKIKNLNESLFISFGNSIDNINSISIKSTNKSNKFLHGHGINNITNIIEQYNGNISFEIKEKMLYVRIMLPLDNQ